MPSIHRIVLACHVVAVGSLVASSAVAQQVPAAAPTSQPSNGGLEAGGLAPPPPMPGDSASSNGSQQPSATEQQLNRAEKEDSGRGLEFAYFNIEGGYEQIGLETFKSNGLTYASTVATKDGGMMFGAGAGIRLLFITLGARARLGKFSQWNVGTLNAEVGIHVPLGDLEPYFTLGGGYAFLGSLDQNNWGAGVSIRGYDIRGGFGLDYYVTPVFSIGGNLTGEVLGLTRPGVNLSAATNASGTGQPGQLDAASQQIAAADGSSMGAAFSASAVLGLHF